MRPRDKLIAAGLLAFVSGLVALMPAQFVFGLIAAGARISGTTGTLWGGAANAVQLGSVRLGHTEWSLRPAALLSARLGAEVSTRWADGSGHGYLTIGFGGAIACEDCEISTSISALRAWAPVPPIGGTLDLDIKVLDIKDGWARRVVGTARVIDMPLGLGGQALPTGAQGSYEASFNADPVPEGGLIEAVVTDVGGALQVTGQLRLTPPGNYQVAGTAQARPDAPAALTSSLPLLGPQRSDGSHEFAFSGTF